MSRVISEQLGWIWKISFCQTITLCFHCIFKEVAYWENIEKVFNINAKNDTEGSMHPPLFC